MIADILKFEIESHADRSHRENPLLLHARAGEVSSETVARYLASLKLMVGSSPGCLSRARDRARALGLNSLATYYAKKVVEETGHEQWADADIVELYKYDETAATQPVPAMYELLELIHATIERDPATYVAYTLWAEYFTVLVGGSFARYLVERCGIPTTALTCLTNHVELDVDHAEETLDDVDALIGDPAQLRPMRELLARVVEIFDRACVEMLDVRAEDVAEHARVAI